MARFVGTGKDPRYPKGQVVDIYTSDDAFGQGNLSEQDLVELGYVEAADPYQDPGRTPSQIAAAVVRGDTLSDPYDAAVAVKEGYVDERGMATAKAYNVVHEDPQDAAVDRGEAGAGPVRGVLSAVRAAQDKLPKAEGADTAHEDIEASSSSRVDAPLTADASGASATGGAGDPQGNVDQQAKDGEAAEKAKPGTAKRQ